MRILKDYEGRAIRLTDERLILIRFQDEANYGILAPWEDRGGWM